LLINVRRCRNRRPGSNVSCRDIYT
jgi:hypothetical protein